jgi:hypothetical protein
MKLVFNHPKHFARGIRCEACHQEFPHKPGKTLHVPVQTCFVCHGSTHGPQGVLAPTSCDTCHTSDVAKMTPDHQASTWVFVKGSTLADHSAKGKADALFCKMCHSSFLLPGLPQGRHPTRSIGSRRIRAAPPRSVQPVSCVTRTASRAHQDHRPLWPPARRRPRRVRGPRVQSYQLLPRRRRYSSRSATTVTTRTSRSCPTGRPSISRSFSRVGPTRASGHQPPFCRRHALSARIGLG